HARHMNSGAKKILVLSAVTLAAFGAAAAIVWLLWWKPTEYVSEAEGFSIRFPAGWSVRRDDDAPIVRGRGLLAPEDGEDPGIITVLIVDLKTLPAAGAGTSWWSPISAVHLQDFARVGDGFMHVAGEKSPWILFSYTEGTDKVLMKGQQFYLRGGTRGYVITCTARPAAFEKFRAEFERTARSLRFL
ncbi:MAG TPA: hypothetical protein VJU16_03965, partial [Planctomycetota bacterium]|nr:hypothetical protein [Planctomycetota bacterium]